MVPSISELWLASLRRHWRPLFAAAAVAVVPALTLNALIESLSDGVIVNGRLVVADDPTTLHFNASLGGGNATLDVPVLTALGWLTAVAVSMAVLNGATVRSAVRDAGNRMLAWLTLGALMVALTFGSLFASLAGAVMGGLPGVAVTFAVLIAALFWLMRLVLAFPAMLVDGLALRPALGRALDVTRGRTLANGVALFLGGFALPALAYGAASRVARGVAGWAGGGPRADTVQAGAAMLVENLAAVAVVPVQAALMFAAYRAAAWTPGTRALPTEQEHVLMRGWMVGGLALFVAVPSAVAATVVNANPKQLLVATVSEPIGVALWNPYTITVLDDGSVAAVDASQVVLCGDAHCASDRPLTPPCIDGLPPQPGGPDAWSCLSEGPYSAADITADGTLVALSRHGATGGQDVRMLWCGVVDVTGPHSTCNWGGATTLHDMPDVWENWSMAVAATPAGGVEALIVGPGQDARHGEIVLVSCDRFECPQPTVRVAHAIDLPNEWYGAGIVDIDVDWSSGALALAYYDATDDSLWLGGCPALCPDGPALMQVASSLGYQRGGQPTPSDVQVVASPRGPAAVVSMSTPDVATVFVCTDLACSEWMPMDEGWTSAWPVVDRAGQVFIVGTAGEGEPPTLRDVRTGDTIRLVGDGRLVAAAFGPDSRLRVLLTDAGWSTLVTCASPHCTAA